MGKTTFPLKLPMSFKKAAQRLAGEDGVSLNQWIGVPVGEKVGVVETSAEFFFKRTRQSCGAGMMRLRGAPNVPHTVKTRCGRGRPILPPGHF